LIIWNDHVRCVVKKERDSLYTVKRVKVNWIGHFWRRNCLPKHVIEGTKKKM